MLALEAKSEAENKPKRIYLSALLLFWPHEGQRLLQDLVTVDHGGELTAGVLPFKSFEGGAVKGVMSMVESLSPLSPDSDLVTVEEFYCLVPDGQKADLLDGVIYMASPDTRRSDRLGGFIKVLLQGYAEIRGLGEVYGSRFAFELSQFRAPEPDVAFVRTARLHLVSERRMVGGPDIAVEIVSRDSRQRDYGEKKQLYAEAGVSEYWIVDPLQRRVEFHRLHAGRYELVPLEHNHIFRSGVLEGFWLDVEWLLTDPLPKAYEKLQEIVARHRA